MTITRSDEPTTPLRSIPPIGPARVRVLLAEDDHQLRSLLSQSLGCAGFDVHAVLNGGLLMQALTGALLGDAPDYDVLVTDIRMPGWSGLAALNGLRCARCSIPVILLTAFPDREAMFLASELGATLLMKPVDLEHLNQTVASSLAPGLSHASL